MKKHALVVLVLTLLAVGTAGAQSSTPYLALGDSVPFGYNPTVPLTTPNLLSNYHGYPQFVAASLNLGLANASCPGQTSSSFINAAVPDNGCGKWRTEYGPLFVTYSSSMQSQLDYAVTFLRQNPKTSLATITIGGDDLLTLEEKCEGESTNAATIEVCELSGLGDVLVDFAKNLTAIYLAIRIEARYSGPIVAVNYFSPDYDNLIVTASVLELNAVTDGLTATFGGKVANVFSVFQKASAASGGLPCSPAVGLAFPNPLGPGGCDVHPTVAGQQLIAGLVVQAAK
jgi:hypothetical protein